MIVVDVQVPPRPTILDFVMEVVLEALLFYWLLVLAAKRARGWAR